VRYGIHLHNHGPLADPRLIADLARAAEGAGWDGFFVCDHLTARAGDAPQPVADPWIALTAVAAATERLLIGPMVTPLPRRRPWQLASETVTLDHLSGGRLVLGVGLGTGEARSFAPFGEEPDLRTRAAMVDESLEVLSGLWRGEPFSFEGTHYQVRDATFLPRPVQRPRVPIWVAAGWPHKRPFRRAARWDGVFVDVEGSGDWVDGHIAPLEGLRASVEYLRSQRTDDAPFEVVLGGRSPPDRGRAADRLAPYADAGLTWWVEGIHPAFGTAAELRALIEAGPARG
jgi:alkanesulfonate monooxygenase SsuD/methylene tetrahydromethanopterin reductase-like flavin-dependent oxidoreductase (luciferase family)